MTVTDLDALARAYKSDDKMDPEILVLGDGLPSSPYTHPPDWNAVLRLGRYRGSTVRFYAPRAWMYSEISMSHGKYTLKFSEEQTSDDEYATFDLQISETTIDRIIFLNPCNDDQPLPDGAEVLTDDGIVAAGE